MAIPGSWTLFYSWGCGTSYASTSLTINTNGTWSNGQGYTGKWVLTEGMFLQIFNGSTTVYGGNTSGNIIAGTMTTFTGLTGCWYAKKAGVTPLKGAKTAAADTSGAKGGAKKGAKKSAKKKR